MKKSINLPKDFLDEIFRERFLIILTKMNGCFSEFKMF